MAASYRCLLATAAAPASMIAEIPWSSISIAEAPNSPETAVVSFSTRQSNQTITVRATGSGGAIEPGSTVLWIEREGGLVFGGIIWLVSGSVPGAVAIEIDPGAEDSGRGRRHLYLRGGTRHEIRAE